MAKKLNVVALVKSMSREETAHLDLRTRTTPKRRKNEKGGGKSWKRHLD